MNTENSLILFAGSSHVELAKEISDLLSVSLGKVLIETFPDGEIGVQILENVRGRDVFVLQTIARHPNHYLMELLIIVDALKRSSARAIVAVIPYFGYARQDRMEKRGEPITARLVANLLETAGVTEVLTMDLHAEQIQGFFDIPVESLSARPLLLEAVRGSDLGRFVVVASDKGGIKLAHAFAGEMKIDLAFVDKRRINGERVEIKALIGGVHGKDVLLVDDIYSTGRTLETAAKVCLESGANRIFAATTHFVASALGESAIEEMWVTNTVPIPAEFKSRRMEVVSVASLFAEAIISIAQAHSTFSLFKE